VAEPSVSAGERDAELVTELCGVIAAQATRIEALSGQVGEQRAWIAGLERRLGADSSNSSRPPSSDSPYRKPAKRSSRRASGGKPGKKAGEPGATMPLVDDPMRSSPVMRPAANSAARTWPTRRYPGWSVARSPMCAHPRHRGSPSTRSDPDLPVLRRHGGWLGAGGGARPSLLRAGGAGAGR